MLNRSKRNDLACRSSEYNIEPEALTLVLLALDTTTRAGSIAIVRDGRLVEQRAGDPTVTHGARLPGDLVRALESSAMRIDDVDLLAVSAGPGSFTGLRVGIATMQGLAFARSLSIVPVPTLEALAFAGAQQARDGEIIAVWIDALRGEVFAALHSGPAAVGRPEEILERWRAALAERPVLFVGDGAIRYRALLESLPRTRVLDPVPLVAGAVGLIAARAPERAVIPHAVVPIYVRRPDAEIARDRRLGQASP